MKVSIVLFTVTRYVVFVLSFARTLLLAKFLGPFYFGILGFLMLVQQYLSYTNCGVQYAANVMLSTQDRDRHMRIIGSSVVVSLAVSLLLFALGAAMEGFSVNWFSEYSLKDYALPLGIIAGLYHFQQLLANIYRVYGKLFIIAAGELINTVVPLVIIFLFSGESLIRAYLWSIIAAGVVSNLILALQPQTRGGMTIDREIVKSLFRTGPSLLLCNISFYLMTLAGRTIVSVNYDVTVMGLYSLAHNIVNAVLLGLDAIVWAVYPTVLSKLRPDLDVSEAVSNVKRIAALHIHVVYLVVLVSIASLPVIFYLVPLYQDVRAALSVLLIAQAILAVSFSYSSFAIARQRQMWVAAVAGLSCVIVTLLSLLVVYVGLSFEWIAVVILVGGLMYLAMQAWLMARLSGIRSSGYYFSFVLSWDIAIVLSMSLLGGILSSLTLSYLGIGAFAVLRRRQLMDIWRLVRFRSAREVE